MDRQQQQQQNRTNQCNPNNPVTGPGRSRGYRGTGDAKDLNNHSRQNNPQDPKSNVPHQRK